MLLGGPQGPWAVNALTLARLQLETFYTLCFILQKPENVRLFVKALWKKKYTRFLLQRAETIHFQRFAEFTHETGPEALEHLRVASFVTEEERRTIDDAELGPSFIGPIEKPIVIPRLPGPSGIIEGLPMGHKKSC